jgi:O-antigen/teichoic acid export membrane protein
MRSRAIKSDFTKNILKLVSGTFIAQLLTILLAPILTRLYAPEVFGLFTLISSIFGVIALISGGRYEVAILLPKKDEDAANLLILSLGVNTIFMLLFYLILICLLPIISVSKDIFWIFTLPILVNFF